MRIEVFYVHADGIRGGEDTAAKLKKEVNEWLEKQGSGIRVERTEQSIVPETRGIFLTIFYDHQPISGSLGPAVLVG